MNLKELTIEQLKTTAYDCMVVIEQHQNLLREINGEIQSRASKPKVETEESKKKK